MILNLHHVPGRLRVCLAALKGNSQAIVPLHSELIAMEGVRSASLSPQTGSVIIYYDRHGFDIESLWTTLRRLGFLNSATHLAPARALKKTDAVVSSAAAALSDALIDAILKHLFGRTASSLIRLLI